MSIQATKPRTGESTRAAGVVCFWAGLIGCLQAIVIIAWPPEVAEARYSYPFSVGGYTAMQVSFFVQHLPLIVGLLALLRLKPVRSSRVARAGIVAGAVGMGLLAILELVAITAADLATDSGRAELVSALYGLPVTLIGVGLIVAGLRLTRSDPAAWTGAAWLRFLPLLLGVWVVVPLTPAIMGPLVAGRLAIGGWMLLFAALGLGVARQSAGEPASVDLLRVR